MYWLLLLLLCFGSSCTATCVRDSDCLGTSVCEDNACHLVVKGDAGRASGGSQSENPSQSGEPSESTSDGGSFSTSADAGN